MQESTWLAAAIVWVALIISIVVLLRRCARRQPHGLPLGFAPLALPPYNAGPAWFKKTEAIRHLFHLRLCRSRWFLCKFALTTGWLKMDPQWRVVMAGARYGELRLTKVFGAFAYASWESDRQDRVVAALESWLAWIVSTKEGGSLVTWHPVRPWWRWSIARMFSPLFFSMADHELTHCGQQRLWGVFDEEWRPDANRSSLWWIGCELHALAIGSLATIFWVGFLCWPAMPVLVWFIRL